MENSLYYRLRNLIVGENYKVRKNFTVWLTLLFPSVVSILVTIIVFCKNRSDSVDIITWGYHFENMNDVETVFREIAQLNSIFPMFISAMCCSVFLAEYKFGGFRLTNTLPFSRLKLYFSKIFLLTEIVTLCYLLFALTVWVCFTALGNYFALTTFSTFPLGETLAKYIPLNIWSLLAITYFQYTMCLLFKNFSIPFSISAVMFVLSLFIRENYCVWAIVNSAYGNTFYSFVNITERGLGEFEYIATTYILISLVWGYILSKKI